MTANALLTTAQRYANNIEKEGLTLDRLTVLVRTEQSELESYIYEPVLCLILQGSKEVMSGNQFARLQQGDVLLVSHNLPVLSRISEATPGKPYVALILSIDLLLIRSLYSEIGSAPTSNASERSLASGKAQIEWLEPIQRYLALMDHPVDTKVLGPSLLREIHYRLLSAPIGAMLRSLMVIDSHASRIGRATHRLRLDFRTSFRIEALAREAGMSSTSFHEHFKKVTGMTPLQYQKELRLTEARDLLLAGNTRVQDAAFSVGYESPAQFSRDYSRKFGCPPRAAIVKR